MSTKINMSKILCALLAVAMMITVTACGGSAPSSNAAAPAGNNQAAPATDNAGAAASGEKATIVYTTWANSDEKKMTEQVAQNFMSENPDITVVIQAIPQADYDTKITAMVASNEKMDIAQLESATIAYPLAEEGKLLDLNTMFSAESGVTVDTYLPGAYYRNGEEIIGIYNGIEIFVLFYSPELFDNAGVPYPPTDPNKAWTWDEFVEVAKKLTIDQNGKNASEADFDAANIKQYGINFGKWWGSWGNFVSANDGYYITDDNKFGLSQPSGYEALQRIADLTNVHKVAPTPTAEKGMPGVDVALATGQYAMSIDGQWASLGLGNAEVNYGVGVLPKMNKLLTQTVSGMNSIYSDSENKDASWKFLNYMMDPESNITQYENGNLMPIKADWLTDPALLAKWTNNAAHPEGYIEAVVGMLNDYSVPAPTGIVKNFNKIMELVTPALDEVWLGEKSAEEAMKAIEDKVNPLVEGKR